MLLIFVQAVNCLTSNIPMMLCILVKKIQLSFKYFSTLRTPVSLCWLCFLHIQVQIIIAKTGLLNAKSCICKERKLDEVHNFIIFQLHLANWSVFAYTIEIYQYWTARYLLTNENGAARWSMLYCPHGWPLKTKDVRILLVSEHGCKCGVARTPWGSFTTNSDLWRRQKGHKD